MNMDHRFSQTGNSVQLQEEFFTTLYDSCEALYRIDLLTEQYEAIKRSSALSVILEDSGDFRELYRKLIFPATLENSDTNSYMAFMSSQYQPGGPYSRRILFESVPEPFYMQFTCYPDADHKVAYVTLMSLPDKPDEPDQFQKKTYAMENRYLYSMLVDLDTNYCVDVFVSEMNLPKQDHIEISFTDWRTMLIDSFALQDQPSFLTQTNPPHIRAGFSTQNRLSFDIKMRTLNGKYIWTRHVMTWIRDYAEDHMQMLYTVQDINEEKTAILDRIRSIENKALLRYNQQLQAEPASDRRGDFPARQGSEHILDQVEEYIHQHYMEKLTLGALGKRFYINSAYLGQLFCKRFKMSFNEYLSLERLSRAAMLLQSTDRLVYEIATEVGFSTLNYFIKQFSAHYGVSPTKYRKLHASGGNPSYQLSAGSEQMTRRRTDAPAKHKD